MPTDADLDHYTLTCHRFGDGWMYNVVAWDEDGQMTHVEGGLLPGTLAPTAGRPLPVALRAIWLTLADS